MADLARRPNQAPPRLEPPILSGRMPCNNLDAEAAVISACMLDRSAIDLSLLHLKPTGEQFYSDANGRIFGVIAELANAGAEKIDLVIIANVLRDRELLANVGGAAYLGQLCDATPAVAHVDEHARIVAGCAVVRLVTATCQMVAATGYGEIGDPWEWAAAAAGKVSEAAGETIGQLTFEASTSIATRLAEQLNAPSESVEAGGVRTNWSRFDQRVRLGLGDLIVVAGRPGMGKSSWALGAILGATLRRDHATEDVAGGVFSLEMNRDMIGRRAACQLSGACVSRADRNRLTIDEISAYTGGLAEFADRDIFVDYDPALTISKIRSRARIWQAKARAAGEARGRLRAEREGRTFDPNERPCNLRIIKADYLQLMKGTRRHGSNREQEVAELSRDLKILAGELGVVLILVSQLNRACEARNPPRPQMSDLRESGAIEQDADAIIFFYRPDYYIEQGKIERGPDDFPGKAEVLISKQRNGQPGRHLMHFRGASTAFHELQEYEAERYETGDE